MLDCDGGGTYEVVRRMCEWNGDSETGQRAQPRLVASPSAGANLIVIVDRRAGISRKCKRTRSTAGRVQNRQKVEGP